MSDPSGSGRGDRGRYTRALLATMGLFVVSAATAIVVKTILAVPPASRELKVEPPIWKLTDRPYEEGAMVRATYRIVNPLKKPVTVRSILTSCTCTTSIPEGGDKPPFVLGPGASAEFTLKTVATARPGPEQTYSARVESECDGKPLPGSQATVVFRVIDTMMAEPRELTAANVPIDQEVHRRIKIHVRKNVTGSAVPTLHISNPDTIQARLIELADEPPGGDKPGYRAKYEIDATIRPSEGSPSVSGTIELRLEDRVNLSIPVHCGFDQKYRLSRPRIEVAGQPGESTEYPIFYEALDPEWRGVEVADTPEGVQVKIEPFDESTRLLRIRVTIPDPPSESEAQDPAVVLTAGSGKHSLTIPIQFDRRAR